MPNFDKALFRSDVLYYPVLYVGNKYANICVYGTNLQTKHICKSLKHCVNSASISTKALVWTAAVSF